MENKIDEIILEDVDGKKIKATKLFTHFDYNFSKNYIVYLVDDDIYILGDYNRLMQVLMNVIKNSIEAIPSEKAGNISIKTDINNNNFYLEISDNGVGIKDEVLKKIGEPFFTTKVNGTGLGVSLSKQIIKAHDGIIYYENNTMGGTSVKIFLPITN